MARNQQHEPGQVNQPKKQNRKRRGRGEGAIFQRESDGRWCAVVSLGYGSDGRRKRRPVYGKSKGEVQEKLKTMHTGQVPTDASKVSVGQYLDLWLESLRASIAEGTYVRYEQVSRLHVKPYIGGIALVKVTTLHVETLFDSLRRAKRSLRTQQMAGILLQTAFHKAVRQHLVPYNPVRDVDKPRPAKKEMMVLNFAQVGKLFAATTTDRLHALFVMAVMSQLREGELFALEWPDIDFEHGAVTVTKTLQEIAGVVKTKAPKTAAGRRRVDLPQFCMDALHEHRKKMVAEGFAAKPVFCNVDGGYLRRPNVQQRSFEPAMKRAKIPRVRFHDLRHTGATLLLLKGVHPKIVSERLGHASIEITLNTYSHVLPTMQKVAADQLDLLFG